MKTAKYFDEYNEYVTGQRENINKIENERQELSQRIKEDKAKYKELIANSQDDEADALYTTFDSNEKKLKALEKRLSTKKKCLMRLDVKRRLNLLNIKRFTSFVQKDKERILAKFEPIIEEFNTVLTEINDLNAKYEEEYNRYTIPYHRENFDEDDEVKGNCEITLEIFYTVHTLQV